MLTRRLFPLAAFCSWALALALLLPVAPAAAAGPAGLELMRATPASPDTAEQRALVPMAPPAAGSPGPAGALGLERPSATVQQEGIAWYLVTRTGAGARLGLLDAGGQEIGAYSIREDEERGRTFTPEWLDTRFADPSRLSVLVWSELRTSPAVAGLPGTGLQSMSSPYGTCDYSFIHTSDLFGGAGLLRSVACERAQDDVNAKCSNSACWGCCELLPCDCVCMAGDLNCLCWASGFPCERSNCEWQPEPDPECEDPGGSGGGGGGGGGGGWGGGSGGGQVCVPVYCNGVYGGEACGTTTGQIVDEAWDICS